MAANPTFTNLAVNTKVNARGALVDGGFLDIYDGAQPATADTAVTTQVRLARLTFGTPAFGAGVAGIAQATAITPDTDADATGTPAWYRLRQSDGTATEDGSVGTVDCDLVLDAAAITVGGTVAVTAFSLVERKA